MRYSKKTKILLPLILLVMIVSIAASLFVINSPQTTNSKAAERVNGKSFVKPTKVPTRGAQQCNGENQLCASLNDCCNGFSCETTPKGNRCKKTYAPVAPTATPQPLVNQPTAMPTSIPPTAVPTAVVNTQCKNENVQCGQSSECCGGLVCKLTGRGTTMCKKP